MIVMNPVCIWKLILIRGSLKAWRGSTFFNSVREKHNKINPNREQKLVMVINWTSAVDWRFIPGQLAAGKMNLMLVFLPAEKANKKRENSQLRRASYTNSHNYDCCCFCHWTQLNLITRVMSRTDLLSFGWNHFWGNARRGWPTAGPRDRPTHPKH